ncbi:MAG TPA: hypothetical protein VN666_10605 [Nitrospira sp.]|nr:hypothetical protein [Nitrospira sp.]
MPLCRALLAQLNDAQKLRWNECLLDGSFAATGAVGSWSARFGWLENFRRLTVRYDPLMST